MLKRILILAVVFFAGLPFAFAQEIENPEAVSYMHVEITKEGSVYLFDNSPFQTARDLKVTLAIPQNTSRQKSFIKSVHGPDRYKITEDKWGNKMVSLYWDFPDLKKRLTYKVVFDVEVSDKKDGSRGISFPQTELTRASPEIARTAYETASGLDDIKRIFRLTEWVHENVRYDNSAKEFSQSAIWTYSNRMGVCDEFSNLLLSMLNVLGYKSHYVVGYAYSENWGQHGWVEVEHNGKTISLDPTWLESPVDSTHIKLAELPDSNFSEYVEVKGGQITIDWNKEEAEVKVISHKKSPRIDIDATLVPENSTSRSYSLLITDFKSVPECLLTSVNLKSCVKPTGESFLSIYKNRQNMAFCGRESAYWFIGSPEIESGVIYTCPVIIYGGGTEKTIKLSIEGNDKRKVKTSVKSQNVLLSGQVFEVRSVTENTGHRSESVSIYVFFAGQMQNKDVTLRSGERAEITWTMKAPLPPGNYRLDVFSSSGELFSQNLTVISQRSAKIENISFPEKAFLGEGIEINISVKASESFSGTLETFIDDYRDVKQISLRQGETKNFVVFYDANSTGTKNIRTALFSENLQYQDGWLGTIEVKNRKQWWDYIADWLESIIGWIAGIFSGRL
ncbi:MAG: transglutaminase-like domain-containing protein [Candidatus Aenigmatarchaeota archaeon]